MHIKLYKLGDYKPRPNLPTLKNARNIVNRHIPITGLILYGELRDAVNVRNPQFIIDISPEAGASIDTFGVDEQDVEDVIEQFLNSNFKQVNYAYIPDLDRYYFIEDVTLLRKNLYSLSLHVDVLQFVDFIKSQTAFVTRNQNDYNIELPDEKRIVLNDSEVSIIEIEDLPDYSTNYFKFDTYFDDDQDVDATNVLNIVAVVHATDIQTTDIAQQVKIDSFIPTLPDVRAGNFIPLNAWTYVLERGKLADLLDYINVQASSKASSVAGIYAYPFNFRKYISTIDLPTHVKTLKVGDGSVNVTAHYIRTLTSGYLLHSAFVLDDTIEDFNDLNPYSTYELYIPYYGYYELNYNALRGHTLCVYYVINYQTGSATVLLYDDTNKCLVTSLQCQLGIEIPKNTSNVEEVINRHNANNLSLGLGLLASALSIGVGIATQNPVAIAGGLIKSGADIGGYVQNEKTNIYRENINFNGTTAPLFAPQNVFIRKRKRKVQYELTSDFLRNNGGVCNELKLLDLVVGYTEIADIPNINYPSTSDYIGTNENEITNEEIDEIITLLKNGVIIL